MPINVIPSFVMFCLINGITPGPANLCSLSAAMRYGRKRALKQWRGLFTGFAVVAIISAFICYFAGAVMGNSVKWLSWIGAGYLLWLAWHTVKSSSATEPNAVDRQCNFWTGLFVQLTNVKIILFCMTALSSYVLPYSQSLLSLLSIALILPFTGPVCNLVWLFAGDRLQIIFVRHEKLLNAIMAVALVLCAISLLISF